MRLPKSVMHSASDATRTENPFSSSPQSGRQESEKNFFMKCPGRFPTGIFFTYFFKILIAFQNLPAEFDMFDLSITSTKTKYINPNTKTQIFLK